MKTEPLAPNDYQGAEVRLCQDGSEDPIIYC